MSIGDRMKENYEDRYRIKLTRRMPVIIRLDGKAFHTLTKYCRKPFDYDFIESMLKTTSLLCSEIQGVKCGYVQSDEISLLLTDYDNLSTEAWFDYNLQKIVSVAAGYASVFFTYWWQWFTDTSFLSNIGVFDARAFNIPKEEVCNYFIWRQQDWMRNSVQMFAQSYFSQKELHGKNSKEIKEMVLNKSGNSWDSLDAGLMYGTLSLKREDDMWKGKSFLFVENRSIIENLLLTKEELDEQKTTGGNGELPKTVCSD